MKRYAVYDQASPGPNLVIEQAGQALAVDDTGLDTARVARGNIYRAGGISRFEQIIWPSGPSGDQDDMEAVVGVASVDHPNNVTLGESEHSIGFVLATGAIRHNSATLATVDPVVFREVVGMRLDWTLQLLTITVNGVIVYEADLSGTGWSGVGLTPATSLGSQAYADQKAYLNTGQVEFEFPDPIAFGWYEVMATIDPLWLGSEDYISLPTDTPANQRIEGVIPLSGVSFQLSRRLSFWTQGEGSVASNDVASLTILDPTGQWDELVSGSVRDLVVPVYEVQPGGSLDAAESVCTLVVDRVEAVDDMRKRLVLKGRMTRFDDPIQRRIFPPSAEEGAANRIVPITYGFGLSITPALNRILSDSSGDTLQYKVNDSTLLGIGFVRDRGDPLEGSGSDPAYYISADLQGIDVLVTPAGKLTADVSSVGGDVPTPPTNLVPSSLGAWDDSDGVTESGGEYTFGGGFTGASGRVESYLRMNGILAPMTNYRYRITVNSLSGVFGGSGQRPRIQFIRSIGAGNEPTGDLNFAVSGPIGAATFYSGVFLNFASVTTDFIVALVGTQSASDEMKVSVGIELYEVDNSEVTSDNLLPMPLADFAGAIIEDRARFSASEWSRESAEAIDVATSAAGIGWHTSDQVPMRQAIEDVFPSYGACLAQDRNGLLSVYRIEAPEALAGESPSVLMGVITPADMLSDLRIQMDEARGLTTRFGLQPNETVLDPTDFVDDFDPVTGVPMQVRAKLSRKYREIVGTAARLARAYSHAYAAPELGTRFLRIADAQAELDRICAIYAVERFFYTVEVPLDAPYDLGQLWTLAYYRYGLTLGKPVIVWGIVEDRIARRATLILWG